jgi:hypothetical protein
MLKNQVKTAFIITMDYLKSYCILFYFNKYFHLLNSQAYLIFLFQVGIMLEDHPEQEINPGNIKLKRWIDLFIDAHGLKTQGEGP